MTSHLTPARRRRRERGQVLPLVAAALLVLTGFAGATVDLGNQFVTKRELQAAADSAALAGAAVLGGATPVILSSAPSWNDPAIYAAHDYAAANGFLTTFPTSAGGSSANYYSPACYTGGGLSNFQEAFFDSAHGTSCTSGFPSTGFTTEVQINVPALTLPGYPTLPTQCNPNATPAGYQYNCIQVVITKKVSNYIMGIFGQPTEYLTAVATGYAQPASGQQDLPPSYAAYLYQPATGCTGQCYTPANAVAKGQLTCTGGSNNCPTLLANNVGAGNIFIQGIDGTQLTPQAHFTAMQSAGHVVNQENSLVFCDPYGGGTCGQGSPTGTNGYALGSGANIYCSGVNGSSTPNNCTNASPPGSLQKITGDGVTFHSASWTAPAVTAPSNDCQGLILNGDPITASNNPPVFFDSTGAALTSVPAACVPATTEPYTIQPGKYNYIVINHGKYEFEGGLFYIYGTAPVNTNSVASGVGANGIDHSQETNAVTGDWDLCNFSSAGSNNSGTKRCSSLTAGVWITQGWTCGNNNKCGALVNSTGTTCANGNVVGGTTGGGGNKTDITGSGVSFYFTSASGGLVSTRTVDSIVLNAPAAGALASIGGAPILINMQNSGWTHLDGNNGQNVQFTGVVYQTPTATAGGVDINASAGKHVSADKATLLGQVYAYSLDFFGAGGVGIDFTNGWGSGSAPPAGSGNNESSLITIPQNALVAAGTGFEKLTVDYTDEWMLDAYNSSIEINSLSTSYFSTPVWSTPPNTAPTQGPYPPQNGYTPSDANPEYMASDQGTPYYTPPSPYVAGAGTHEYSVQSDPGQPDNTTWDVSGDWNWGNQSNLTGSSSGNYAATISYTFPTPAGTQVTVVLHTVDGDHCGDYDNTTATFTNVGSPGGGGIATRGTSLLVQ